MLPRTLVFAAIVLTVCCVDGGVLRQGVVLTAAEVASEQQRPRAEARRQSRPTRRAVRPTAVAIHQPATTVESSVAFDVCRRDAVGVSRLSYAELRMPPPAA